MKTYQIEITDSAKTVVKRINFQVDEGTAYAMFDEWTHRYDSSHTLEVSDKRTGELLPWGQVNGFEKWA